MSQEVIGVDIDDVISSQAKVFMSHMNDRHRLGLTEEDFMVPGEYWAYFENVLARKASPSDNPEEWFRRFLEEKIPLKQVIDNDVRHSLGILRDLGYRLEVITSRGADWHQDTVHWLEEHANGVFEDVHIVDLWSEKLGEKATKAAICREIGAGYLIDDNIEHCNYAAEAGVKALLFGRYGWNSKGDVHPDVIRIDGWSEVVEYFENAAK